MDLELAADESAFLLETLREELGRLKAEINRTEAHDFKEELKASEATLVRIIGKLEDLPSAGP
jgi:hypothetical protein